MCGIVGAIANRNVLPVLLEGLQRLEYRGYDSAGLAVRDIEDGLKRFRTLGKVKVLKKLVEQSDVVGNLGIAHTRWATHGVPAERNAHPHVSGVRVAVVHNGIVENHVQLRERLVAMGYEFTSETDTEVIAHLMADKLEAGADLLAAVIAIAAELDGAYALAAASPDDADRIVVTRSGSPLVIGLGDGENFIASDVTALLSVTKKFIFLEEGDVAEVCRNSITIYNAEGDRVERAVKSSRLTGGSIEKEPYAHYMLKEIFEQPSVISETLEGRIHNGRLLESSFGHETSALLDKARHVQIVACGTSYHAGLVARYWLEEVGMPCSVEVERE